MEHKAASPGCADFLEDGEDVVAVFWALGKHVLTVLKFMASQS